MLSDKKSFIEYQFNQKNRSEAMCITVQFFTRCEYSAPIFPVSKCFLFLRLLWGIRLFFGQDHHTYSACSITCLFQNYFESLCIFHKA